MGESLRRIDHSILNEPRSAGVLLHPTSLPGAYGIGTLGDEAFAFIDFLARAGQRLWQVCPLGPTGYGDSPYQCFSAFAGNPLLIGLEPLERLGYLAHGALDAAPRFGLTVEYGSLIPWKMRLLRESFERFGRSAAEADRAKLRRFEHLNRGWLDDYALFAALKDAHGGAPWTAWDASLRDRDPATLDAFGREHRDRIALTRYLQWLFHTQWYALRAVASVHGIRIVGDLPIFVAHDSADVWAHRDLFELDEVGSPTVVAGVPPDYFSATGQLWGNPIYRWDAHRADGFSWWIDVLSSKFRLYDFVRIDHFRGFNAYWSIPAGETTALKGRWVPAPGAELFRAAEARLGRLPVLAEDLGVITPDVVALIEEFGFARMKVLQFAFSANERNLYLPHNYDRNAVVYTGTHDNDTTLGWLATAPDADREFAADYVGASDEPQWRFIRAAVGSAAQFAIVPAQDIVGLGSEGRMNTPGTLGGNWTFRLSPGALTDAHADRLANLADIYGRL